MVVQAMTTTVHYPPMADAHRRIWRVRKHDRVFARLEDARVSDMFWVRYTIIDLTTTTDDRLLLFSRGFWLDEPLPSFEHVETGFIVNHAFAGTRVNPSLEEPFVIVRALYPPAEQVTSARERLKRWLRGFGK
jgi:hypothetical protein